jgi:hypothetical protein
MNYSKTGDSSLLAKRRQNYADGGLVYNPGGGLSQTDPGNIAYYNKMMGGGADNPRMTAEGYTPRYTDRGILDEHDPANIAEYYRKMNPQPAAAAAPAAAAPAAAAAAPAQPTLPAAPAFTPQTLTQTTAKAPPIPQQQNVQPYVKTGPVV